MESMTNRERMNVYITTSRKNLAYAYVAIYSLFEKNIDSEVFLYVVSEDLQEQDMVNEYQAAEKFGHHIIIIPFDDEIARGKTTSSDEKHWPMATMSCYWLFHVLLPEDVDRIMAIESDTVTLGSLYDVYHVDMEEAYMACPGPEHKPSSHIEYIHKLNGQCVTFVLSVYDVNRIRRDYSLETILETDALVRKDCGRSQMEFTFGILFNGKIKYIPGNASCLDENRRYMEETLGWDYIIECEKKCRLLHFSSYSDYAKPWNPVWLMPGYVHWWKYAVDSPYFKEYLTRQWKLRQNEIDEQKKIRKNISYRNILMVAMLLICILLIAEIALISKSVVYCLIGICIIACSFVITLVLRWGAKYII